MRERIKLVINNHQMSCQILQKNLYILRGFKPVEHNVDIPVEKYTGNTDGKSNLYLLEEEWDGNKIEGFVPVFVNFNFFEHGYLNDNGEVVAMPTNDYDAINIFNTINALNGITEDLTLNDDQRIAYLKSIDVLN